MKRGIEKCEVKIRTGNGKSLIFLVWHCAKQNIDICFLKAIIGVES